MGDIKDTLKRLLIRCDYSGTNALGVEGWINKEKSELLSVFQKSDEADCGTIKIDLSDLKRVTEETGLSIKELNRGHLYVFSGGGIEEMPDDVTLEISHIFMTMTVKCHPNIKTEIYFNYMSKLIESFLKNDKFIRVNRLGIRQMNVFTFRSHADMDRTLNSKALSSVLFEDIDVFGSRQYQDRYVNKNEDGTEIEELIYKRELKIRKDSEGNDLWIAVIDSDCSKINKNIFRPEREQLDEISYSLDSRINKFLYNSMV